MTACILAIPGDLSNSAGGYLYARKIIPLLAERLAIAVCSLPAGFPAPSEAEVSQAAALLAAQAPDTVLLVDGLAYGALPAAVLTALKNPVVPLIHHPLGLEEDFSVSERSRLLKMEGEALALARRVIVPSRGTARELTRLYGVPASAIAVAEPGVLRGKRAAGAPPGEPPHIVSAGALTPRKGFGVLLDALNEVRDLPWRATIAGAADRSPDTAALVRRKIAAFGLDKRVRLAGHLGEEAISALYNSADIFALASLYEGYGMVFAEAMAHGLPVVASGEGAVRETVSAGAGFVCATGDVGAFADALRALLSDASLRRGKAAFAWEHGQTLPRWRDAADKIAEVLTRAAQDKIPSAFAAISRRRLNSGFVRAQRRKPKPTCSFPGSADARRCPLPWARPSPRRLPWR
jgi:glycosyltransferase involved in cell wall biosynthesis